jgi:SRSO17 transposase
VAERLGDPDAVLVLDETGFLKKGDKSAGVQRQYSGTAGRIENCQVGVFLGYASRHGRALIDRALYLPERWIGDPVRCAAAGIPKGLTLTTKPQLGLAMLDRALDADVPFAWVTGDSVYGADHRIRRRLEARRRGYVLAVTSRQRLGFVPVEDWLAKVPPDGWRRLSAGDGAKGPRLYDWGYLPYRGAAPGWRMGLLIRRGTAEPEQLAYYLTHVPAGTTLARLVRVAGTRWAIEGCFEAAKGEVGLDEYEVRSWTGWHRHVTLAMLAHAYLAVLRKAALGGSGRARPRRRAAAPHRT